MKHIKILNWFRVFLVTILATFTLASCDSKVSEQSTTADQEVSMDDVQENLETTYQTFEGYLYDQKKEMVERANKRMDRINHEIETMEQHFNDHASEMQDSLQENTMTMLNELKVKKMELSQNLDKLESSSSEAWNKMKGSFNKALKELESSLDKAGETMKG